MINLLEINEIISRSHSRCEFDYMIPKDRVFPLKVVSGLEFKKLCSENSEIIKVARPFMKILYDFLKGSGFFLDLTDKDGIILVTIGDKDVIDEAKVMNMAEGSNMSEESTGTNAIGTSIYTDSPIQMAGKQHYLNAYHVWTCSADTIHDKKGNIIGCLNLTGKRQFVHKHTLGLVVAAVKSIENYLEMKEFQNKLFAAYQYLDTVINSMDMGVITVNCRGHIKSINDVACKMIGIGKDIVKETNIENIIEDWKHIYDQITRPEYENIDRTVYLNKKSFNLNISPIRDGKNKILAVVIMLKDIQKVYNMVNKYTGMRARYSFSDILGRSRCMMRLKEYAVSISDSPSTVLIEGESGTGKELFAQAIHNSSCRRNYGFVAINCGAIPKNLIESELFGYEEGTFTGAKKGGQIGKFELANHGTIFLDEIGEMPLDMQVNLLRVLQEGCIMRIGGRRYIKIDVRIIAATNKNLKEEVLKGNFREDLYYRLSVIPIHVPPLRERGDDIKLLIDYFLKIKCSKLNKNIPYIRTSLYDKLLNYNWPGNVRELENCIENIVNMDGNTSFDFDKHISNDSCESKNIKSRYDMCTLEEWEKLAIDECIRKCGGNLAKTSRILGINRSTLYNKIKKYENIN